MGVDRASRIMRRVLGEVSRSFDYFVAEQPAEPLHDTDNRRLHRRFDGYPRSHHFGQKGRYARKAPFTASCWSSNRRGRCDRTLSQPTRRAVPPTSTKTPLCVSFSLKILGTRMTMDGRLFFYVHLFSNRLFGFWS